MKKVFVFCCAMILFTGLQANASPIMDSGIYFSTTHIEFWDHEENAGYESDFGLFSMANPNDKIEIFNFKEEPKNNNGNGENEHKGVSVDVSDWDPLATGFGFYFDVHTDGKKDKTADYTWYSDPSLNQVHGGGSIDLNVEHVLLTYFRDGYIHVSLDDQLGVGDGDFDDMVIYGKSSDINTISAVPEAATMILFGTGLACLAGFSFRKKKK